MNGIFVTDSPGGSPGRKLRIAGHICMESFSPAVGWQGWHSGQWCEYSLTLAECVLARARGRLVVRSLSLAGAWSGKRKQGHRPRALPAANPHKLSVLRSALFQGQFEVISPERPDAQLSSCQPTKKPPPPQRAMALFFWLVFKFAEFPRMVRLL